MTTEALTTKIQAEIKLWQASQQDQTSGYEYEKSRTGSRLLRYGQNWVGKYYKIVLGMIPIKRTRKKNKIKFWQVDSG